ncbi:MAG: hypothetical protein LBR49_08845 [Tannerella sp.]|jgi:hypothetical protein|nr:hypothetical protein [Tannerella sp.]
MKRVIYIVFVFFVIRGVAKAQIRFDTAFESGSVGSVTLLDSAYLRTSEKDSTLHLSYIVESRFDPLNPVDTALRPSARWFYFRMTGAKNKYIYFHFKHTDPLRAVYSYDNRNFTRFAENEAGMRKISKRFERDTVYIAYFTPYTNTYLQSRIDAWSRHRDVAVENIGNSFHDRPMPMLTITDKTVDNSHKRTVWIHGRTHTSETPGSWQLDGLIDALLADNEDAETLRQAFIFYIVPFTNPDGVAEGLSRSNATGVNQEINWNREDSLTVVEVKNLKRTMAELTALRPFDLMLNMHSQVANSATYWVHTAASTNEKFFGRQMLLCYLNMFGNGYLAPSELSFSAVAPRYPEGWLWDNFGDRTVAITLETPYTYYGESQIWVTPENLSDFGKATLQAVAMYFGVSMPGAILIDNENAKTRGKWKTESSGKYIYLGDDCLSPQKVGNRITYRHKKLPAGKYRILRWKAGANSETPTPGANQLLPAGTHVQKKTSGFKYKLKATSADELFDALLLLKIM